MTDIEAYVERLDFYLLPDGKTVNIRELINAVHRLSARRMPEEVAEFEEFIKYLIDNEYLSKGNLVALNYILVPLRNIMEAKLDDAAAKLRE